ncbi:MAG: hypothetical protein Q9218_003950 [Villophora microphyllina]
MPEVSFVRRNIWIILLGLAFHSSLIVLTTMLVLIIQAAISKPPKYINRGFFIGLMLSFGTCFMSMVLIYMKYSERKRSRHRTEGLGINLEALNEPEPALPQLNTAPRDIDALRTVIRNWEHGAQPTQQDLRSMMVSRNQPSAVANVAGDNNNIRANTHCRRVIVPDNEGNIELQTLPSPHQPLPHIPDTAIELQRFLDHELQRQEAIKRRISNWLQGISTAQETAHLPQRRDSLVPLPLLKHRQIQVEVPQLQAVPIKRDRRGNRGVFGCPLTPSANRKTAFYTFTSASTTQRIKALSTFIPRPLSTFASWQ